MPRFNLGLDAELLNQDKEPILGVEVRLGVGMGPATLTLRPRAGEQPMSLQSVVKALVGLLKIDALDHVSKLSEAPVWGKIFDLSILPELTVELAPQANALQARFKLYAHPDRSAYGVRIADYLPPGLTIEPDITLYDLIIGYRSGKGLDLRARVKFPPQQSSDTELTSGAMPPEKTEIVKYPFPTPSAGGPLFRVEYLGLGQRFGPTANLASADPIGELFEELKNNLRSNDPATILKTLVTEYYHPDRNWFVAADIDVKGWRIQAIFNDPAIYGLRVTCDDGGFTGLKFEILYQKLGPDLGVFYGAISLPEQFRQIMLGAVSLTLPSFKIWVYTNGDFRVEVGWPLGADSIGFEVYIFNGGCAFYFAKLRSGLAPQPPDAIEHYNPILEFGLGIKVGVGRSLRKGVLSAELSLTLHGVFEGILAWRGDPPAGRALAEPNSLGDPPDYYWFAATVGVVGLLQGSVDLAIIKASVSVRLSASASIAFELGYGTAVTVSASVTVTAEVRIIFVTIKASFSATITETFEVIGSDRGYASVAGPLNPSFRRLPPRAAALAALAAGPRRFTAAEVAADAAPDELRVRLMLFPAATYDGDRGTTKAVAIPMLEAPDAEGAPGDYAALLIRLARWLLRSFAPPAECSWAALAEALGQGAEPAPDDFETQLLDFLGQEIRFVLEGVDLSDAAGGDPLDLSPLPMFPVLRMAVTGREAPIDFDADRTPRGYEQLVRAYFEDLDLNALSPEARPPTDLSAPMAGPPRGRSVSGLQFTDFFLLLGRDLAHRLAAVEPAEAALEEMVRAVASEVAGMAAHTLLRGVLLPDPRGLTPGGFPPLDQLQLAGLYDLSLQQVPVDPADEVAAATFSIAADRSPLAKAIAFADGPTASTTTARLPVAPAPPAPAPVWSGRADAPEGADIVISRLPAVAEVRSWFASRRHAGWEDGKTPRVLLFPPSELLTLSEAGPVALRAQSEPPIPGEAPRGDIEAIPCLAVQFRISRVPAPQDPYLDAAGDSAPAYLEGLYRISTTSDETRARVGALLAAPEIGDFALGLLHGAPEGGYSTAPPGPAILFKTNLSTLTQPETPMRLMAARLEAEEEAPTSARLDQPRAFLRLVWEASVVNASGFYLGYAAPDGGGLPDDIFDPEGVATVTLVAQTSTDRLLRPFHDALILPEAAREAVFIAMEREDGAPLVSWEPAYPAGCLGLNIEWHQAASQKLARDQAARPLPYDPQTIAALYDMIQYRLIGQGSFDPSLWSLPMARAQDGTDLAAGAASGAGGPGSYKQVVPVARFAKGRGLYTAAGKEATLEFRLLDVYGNALGDAAHRARFPLLYHDPLVPLGEWPGLQAAYRIEAATAGGVLVLALEFQPRLLLGEPPAAGDDDTAAAARRDKACRARHRYTTIREQLQDPNVDIELRGSLFGDDQPLAGARELRHKLATFAGAIRDALDSFLGEGTEPKRSRTKLRVPFDPARLTEGPRDIFPIEFRVALIRTAHVDPLARQHLPASVEVRWALPPDLARHEDARTRPGESSLGRFAARFEAAFDGFDGAAGSLRLATSNGAAGREARGGAPLLWGVRLSAEAGLHMAFRRDQAAYFAMLPLSTHLQGGEVEVTVYDPDLEHATESRTFSEIDLDRWARRFLDAMESCLSPAAAAAALDAAPADFAALIAAKRLVARCLRAGVDPVFERATDGADDLRTFGARRLVDGDLEAARDRFEAQALARLSAAYENTVLLQVPLDVRSADRDPPADDAAPRLFGGGQVRKMLRDGKRHAESVSISNARAPVTPPPGGGPRFPTFLIKAAEPEREANLDLGIGWRATFIEHLIDPEQAYEDYTPSSWLRLIETGRASPLDFELGTFRVPTPVISFPANPVLESQTATQVAPPKAAGAAATGPEAPAPLDLRWTYRARFGTPGRTANDRLHATLLLNEPIEGDDAPGGAEPLRAVFAGEIGPLFHALARFLVAWDRFGPLVERLSAGAPAADDPAPARVFGILASVAQEIAQAWAAYRGLIEVPAARMLRSSAAPVVRRIDYEIDFEHAERNAGPVLTVTSGQKALWPRIDDVEGGPIEALGEDRWARRYRFKRLGERLDLSFRSLDAMVTQTARMTAQIVRNANLSAGEPARPNPALIYRTPEIAFARPAIALLRLSGYGPVAPLGSLEETLAAALVPLLRAGSAAAFKRRARIETRYAFDLTPDSRAGTLTGVTAVLLSESVVAAADDAASGEGQSPRDIAAAIARDVELWRAGVQPDTRRARLIQSLSLFADMSHGPLPLLTLSDIVYEAPRGWWPEDST